jgi:hypothetical protein
LRIRSRRRTRRAGCEPVVFVPYYTQNEHIQQGGSNAGT